MSKYAHTFLIAFILLWRQWKNTLLFHTRKMKDIYLLSVRFSHKQRNQLWWLPAAL